MSGGDYFLSWLTADQRSRFVELASERSFSRGESIAHFGDSASDLFVISHGQVKLTMFSQNGREFVVDLAGPGEMVGEASLIDGGARSATVTALTTPTVVLALGRADFRSMIQTDPYFCDVVLEQTARRTRRLHTLLLEHVLDDVAGRVARRLIALERFGREQDGSLTIRLPITQQELADWAGVSRQAVVKELHRLREDKIISTRGSTIVLHDRDAILEQATRLEG